MDRRLDIYSDFLLTSVGLATATGLSTLLDGDLSQDAIRAKLLIAANRAAFKELARLSHSGEYSTYRA